MCSRLKSILTSPFLSAIFLSDKKTQTAQIRHNVENNPHSASEITIRQGLPDAEDAEFVARLQVEAFLDKKIILTGEKNLERMIQGRTVLYQNLPQILYQRRFIAECEGIRVGMMSIQFQNDPSPIKETLRLLWKMNLMSTVRMLMLVVWQVRYFKIEPKQCCLEEICIKEKYRGRGIGTLLLQKADEEAKKNGCNSIFLYVVHDNPAQRLYQRHGYTRTKEITGYLLRSSLGIEKSYQMDKTLT